MARYTNAFGVILFAIVGAFIVVRPAPSQSFASHEINLGLDTETATDSRGERHLFSGPLGRYDYNVSARLAIEGSVAYLLGRQGGEYIDTGHELLVSAGPKAGWRFQRFGVFGTIRPGFVSYDQGIELPTESTSGPQFAYYRRTHFALQDGGVVEYYPTGRTFLRLDIGQTVIGEFDQTLERSSNSDVIQKGHVAEHLFVGISAGYRFGKLRSERDESVAFLGGTPYKGEAGILYGLHVKEHLLRNAVSADNAIGAWGDYGIARWLALDGAIFYLPQDDKERNYQDGGQALELYLGGRAGLKTGHFGYFAKVRPGLVQFEKTINSQQTVPSITTDIGRFTNVALDTGGIVETYLPRKLVLRAEAGNDLIFYRAKDVLIDGVKSQVQATHRASLLVLFGVGMQF